MLFMTTIISGVTMVVIFRSLWKNKTLPTLLYSITVVLFSGMAIDLLLDQVYLPFRNWYIVINEHRLWVSNILLAFFIVGGFLFWYFAVIYSQYERPPWHTNIISFIAGGALFGELVKGDWSAHIPIIGEALAFIILGFVIVRYAMRVLRATDDTKEKRWVGVYFLGFLIWIIAGLIGVVIANIPGVPYLIGQSWSVPYSIGLLMISVTVAVNPKLLFVSEAMPLDLLILDKEGTLVFAHRFHDYSGSVDSELMGSAMSGVVSLMKEMLATDRNLHRVDHGDIKILVESGALTTSLLVVTEETARFRQSLRNATMEFESNYRDALLRDSAFVTDFVSFRERAKALFL